MEAEPAGRAQRKEIPAEARRSALAVGCPRLGKAPASLWPSCRPPSPALCRRTLPGVTLTPSSPLGRVLSGKQQTHLQASKLQVYCFFLLFFSVEVKFTSHKVNPFEVSSSLAFSTVIILCHRRFSLVPQYFTTPQ